MASFHKSTSYYTDTPVRDFYLDIWVADNVDVLPDITDEEYIIESKYKERPDLLAAERYGSPNLWWVLPIRNKDVLIDPIADFQPGLTIWLPSSSRIAGIR